MTWVYILRCSDHSLYVGNTENLDARLRAHNEGRGGSYTARRRPLAVAYHEELPSIEDARRREHQLKRWSRLKKEALVAGAGLELRRLSRSRNR